MNKADLEKLVARIKFPGYTFEVLEEQGICNLYVTYMEPDVFSGVNEKQRSRPWPMSFVQEPIQVVQTAFKALLTSLEHRARENFTVDGLAVLEPHYNLDVLLKIAAQRQHDAKPIEIARNTLGAKEGAVELGLGRDKLFGR